VELGLPLTVLVCGLLGLALWQGGQRARQAAATPAWWRAPARCWC